jgi:hypothetical protein
MRNLTEHVIFAALLIPTLLLLSAAVVSLAPLDTSVAVPTQVSLLAVPEDDLH